jgi:hypothetical protein
MPRGRHRQDPGLKSVSPELFFCVVNFVLRCCTRIAYGFLFISPTSGITIQQLPHSRSSSSPLDRYFPSSSTVRDFTMANPWPNVRFAIHYSSLWINTHTSLLRFHLRLTPLVKLVCGKLPLDQTRTLPSKIALVRGAQLPDTATRLFGVPRDIRTPSLRVYASLFGGWDWLPCCILTSVLRRT